MRKFKNYKIFISINDKITSLISFFFFQECNVYFELKTIELKGTKMIVK